MVIMKHLLILGDGNFTFSKSLVDHLLEAEDVLSHERESYSVVCTSFDTQTDVLRKYPESQSILQYLRKNPQVQVVHSVDATQSLCSCLQLIQRDSAAGLLFDYLVFNFPHLGIEDCHRHASMLGHLIYRANEVLSSDGIFYLTLANEQAQNWKLDDMCKRNNFKVTRILPFQPSFWPGYQMKRHQVGKSFQSRAPICSTFCLMRESCSTAKVVDTNNCIFSAMNTRALKSQVSEEKGLLSPTTAPSNTTTGVIPPKQSKSRSKKRKMDRLTEGMYRRVTVGEVECTNEEFTCNICGKKFAHEQGARTHAYAMHVLTSVSSVSTENAEANSSFICDECDPPRDFVNSDALFQHKIARHKTGIPLGTTLAGADSSSGALCENNGVSGTSLDKGESSSVALTECPVCGDVVESVEEHMNSFAPPTHPDIPCPTCGKVFHSNRSFSQHAKFCISTDGA